MAAAGETFGAYTLEEEIGVGGMGRVFRARHTILGRPAAIKVLNDELANDEGYVSRFVHEAKIVNEIRHPNIIDVYDFLILEGPKRVAYVMELLVGRSLSGVVYNRLIDGTQAMHATIQLTEALEAVHAVGVVHRDLKPENIFVIAKDADWSKVPSIKILDFGIAKFHRTDVAHQTQAGAVVGTPSYMAPEQVYGSPVSAATDVYAVGEILCEMLTGARLFVGSNAEIFKQKASGIGLPPVYIPGTNGGPLKALIERCISTEPQDRPTLADIRAVCRRILERGESSRIGITVSDIARVTPVVGPTWLPSQGDGASKVPEPQVQAAPAPKAGVPTMTARPVKDVVPVDRPRAPVTALPRPTLKKNDSSARIVVAAGLVGVAAVAGFVILKNRSGTAAPAEVVQVATVDVPNGQHPSADPIWVMLKTAPSGADVLQDGSRLGRTPLNVPVDPKNPRRVTVQLGGFKSETVLLDGSSGEASLVLAPGDDAQAPDSGFPDAQSTPAITSEPARPRPEPEHRPPDPEEVVPPMPARPSPDAGGEIKPLRKDEVTSW